jgi:V/A-type H+/Na+-transporting ATPase subunit E
VSVKDGLSAIANEVLADVQKEAIAIVLEAKNHACEALKTAKQQADKNYQTILSLAVARAEAEKRRIASVTEVEMRNYLLEAKEELVDAAFEKALVRLKEFAATKDYQRYLLKLIKEVATGLGQKSLVIQVNARDKAWLTQEELNHVSKRLNCELKLLDETEDFIGGFKTQTADGKITFDSTIDNKLNELKPQLRVELAKIMFKEEK